MNTVWIVVCAVLALLIQPGFACLRASRSAPGDDSAVALKMLVGLCVSCLVFVAIGSQLMFGPSIAGWIGRPELTSDLIAPEQFLYFAALGAVATAIVSSALGTRGNLTAHVVVAITVSGLAYPLVGHWAWSESGWLATRTFFDGAGAAVVHSIAGWMALGVLLATRSSRAEPSTEPNASGRLDGSLAMVGALLVWIGWLGLHGGAELRFEGTVPGAVLATLLAGAAGGTTTFVTSLRSAHPGSRTGHVIGGVIAGLVSVSGAVTLLTMRSAVVVAAVGGLIYAIGSQLMRRVRVDDATGVVPAHLLAGIWGTLAVALPAPFGGVAPGTDVLPALGTQAVGVATIGLFAFPVAIITTKLTAGRRPSTQIEPSEPIKIEVPQSSTNGDWAKLAHALDQRAGKNSIRPLQVDVTGESEVFAKLYNQVAVWLRASQDEMEHLRSATGRDPLTGLYNRATFLDYLEKALAMCKRTNQHGAVLFIDMDGFKPVNDHWGHSAGDSVLREVGVRMRDCLRENDVVARVGGDEFCVIIELLDEPAYAIVVAKKILSIFDHPFVIDSLELMLGASIGIASFSPEHSESAGSMIKQADEAMYTAKAKGKGRYSVHRKSHVDLRGIAAHDGNDDNNDDDEMTNNDGSNAAMFPPPTEDDQTGTA